MKEKWAKDLAKLKVPTSGDQREARTATTKAKKSSKSQTSMSSEDEDEALDRESELIAECGKASYADTSVAELCDKTFKDVVERTQVPRRKWLLEFYSSAGTGNTEAMRMLMPVWKRLADV